MLTTQRLNARCSASQRSHLPRILISPNRALSRLLMVNKRPRVAMLVRRFSCRIVYFYALHIAQCTRRARSQQILVYYVAWTCEFVSAHLCLSASPALGCIAGCSHLRDRPKKEPNNRSNIINNKRGKLNATFSL